MHLRANQVTHYYGRRAALRSISLEFSPGATLLLGPNGAGKSTLLEILATARRPTRGSVELVGMASSGVSSRESRKYRAAVAWLPQATSTYPGVHVREHVALSGWLKGMSRAEAWSESAKALDAVQLSDYGDQPIKALSGGQLRRLGIAGALAHRAEVLLFDEPTASLDPSQRRAFRRTVSELSLTRTIVVSSHDTEEAIDSFKRVVVIDDGVIRFNGTPAEFTRDVPGSTGSERMQIAYERWTGAIEQ